MSSCTSDWSLNKTDMLLSSALVGSLPFINKYTVSIKLECSASCSTGIPRYRKIPFSPSMKVMELVQLPVLAYPGSNVIKPVIWRRFEMSMAFSPSLPVTIGSSYVLPSKISLTLSSIFHLCVSNE